MKRITLIIFILVLGARFSFAQKEIKDDPFKFAFTLPAGWTQKDKKETKEADGISYSFLRDDTACAIMLLAFRIQAVKNLDDFVYTMEKDASLNIPPRDGEFILGDASYFDWKIGYYKDMIKMEKIYYFRTKEPDAPSNYVYMMRFISDKLHDSEQLRAQISKIADTFVPVPQ